MRDSQTTKSRKRRRKRKTGIDNTPKETTKSSPVTYASVVFAPADQKNTTEPPRVKKTVKIQNSKSINQQPADQDLTAAGKIQNFLNKSTSELSTKTTDTEKKKMIIHCQYKDVPLNVLMHQTPIHDREVIRFAQVKSNIGTHLKNLRLDQWNVLTLNEMYTHFPWNNTNRAIYWRMEHRFGQQDVHKDAIFLANSDGNPFYGLIDTGAEINAIHPACVAAMFVEAPTSVRVITHLPAPLGGVVGGISATYHMTCVLRLCHHGRTSLIELPIIDDLADLLIFGQPFMNKFRIETYVRPTRVRSHTAYTPTIISEEVKEALKFKELPPYTLSSNATACKYLPPLFSSTQSFASQFTTEFPSEAGEEMMQTIREAEEEPATPTITNTAITTVSTQGTSTIKSKLSRSSKRRENLNRILARAARSYEIPTGHFGRVCVVNRQQPDGDYLFLPLTPMYNDVKVPAALVRLTKGRGFLHLMNESSDFKVIPRGAWLGKLEPVSTDELDEAIVKAEKRELKERVRRLKTADPVPPEADTLTEDGILTPGDVADQVPVATEDDQWTLTEEQWKMFKFGKQLTEEQLSRMKKLLQKHRNAFALSSKEIGKVKDIFVCIDTGDNPACFQKQFRLSSNMAEEIRRQVKEGVELGIMSPSNSPYNSPVFLVAKADGTWRMVVDFRALNTQCTQNTYPIPRIDEVMDRLAGSTIYCSLDANSGFWQMELDEESKKKTAFSTPDGKFHYNRMPFGYINAPAEFQAMMDRILGQLKWTTALVYIDDVLVYGADFDQVLERLDLVLTASEQYGLTYKPSKCQFGFTELKFLGHIISGQGYQVDPDKIRAIQEFPTPRSFRQVRQFLGMCNYYRKYIKGFSMIAAALYRLLTLTHFEWTGAAEEAFMKLKELLTKAPVLHYPVAGADIQITTDASGYGIGAVCEQSTDGGKTWHPLAYCSRTLKDYERKYTATHRECLAVVYALKQFRPYFYGQGVRVYTDHQCLTYLYKQKDPYNQLARWALEIAAHQAELIYKPGAAITHVDCLSRNPVGLYELPIDAIQDDEMLEKEPVVRMVSTSKLDEFRAAQIQDGFIDKIVKKMLQETVPEEGTGNRFWKNYAYINRILYYQDSEAVTNPYRLVVPVSLQRQVFQLMHDSVTGGHFGVLKTYAEMKRRYWWPGMYSDTKRYIGGCIPCQQYRPPNAKVPGEMANKMAPDRVFERVAIDYIQKTAQTKSGNQYALVMVDQTSRYVIAAASKTARADDTIRLVQDHLFSEWGIPAEIVCDNGTHFTAKKFQKFCEDHGINLVFTTAFRPQSNGMVEQANKVLKDYIHKYCHLNKDDWDLHLRNACFARNTKVNETTGYTPYYLAKGWNPRVVADNLFPVIIPDDNDSPEELEAKRERAVLHAQKATELAQKRRKAKYDEQHPSPGYQVGDLVWRLDPTRKPGEPRLKGPYRIIKQTDTKTFEVERLFHGKEQLRTTCVAEQLVPYVPPMFDDPYAQQRLRDHIEEEKEELQKLPPQIINHDSDYFKAIIGETFIDISSIQRSQDEEEDSDGPEIASESEPGHPGANSSTRVCEQVVVQDQGVSGTQLGRENNSNSSPMPPVPEAQPTMTTTATSRHVQQVNNCEKVVIPISAVPTKPQVEQQRGGVDTLSSISSHEDPRDARDSDYEPDEEEDEFVIILEEGPAMGTRSRTAQQQQQKSVVNPEPSHVDQDPIPRSPAKASSQEPEAQSASLNGNESAPRDDLNGEIFVSTDQQPEVQPPSVSSPSEEFHSAMDSRGNNVPSTMISSPDEHQQQLLTTNNGGDDINRQKSIYSLFPEADALFARSSTPLFSAIGQLAAPRFETPGISPLMFQVNEEEKEAMRTSETSRLQRRMEEIQPTPATPSNYTEKFGDNPTEVSTNLSPSNRDPVVPASMTTPLAHIFLDAAFRAPVNDLRRSLFPSSAITVNTTVHQKSPTNDQLINNLEASPPPSNNNAQGDQNPGNNDDSPRNYKDDSTGLKDDNHTTAENLQYAPETSVYSPSSLLIHGDHNPSVVPRQDITVGPFSPLNATEIPPTTQPNADLSTVFEVSEVPQSTIPSNHSMFENNPQHDESEAQFQPSTSTPPHEPVPLSSPQQLSPISHHDVQNDVTEGAAQQDDSTGTLCDQNIGDNDDVFESESNNNTVVERNLPPTNNHDLRLTDSSSSLDEDLEPEVMNILLRQKERERERKRATRELMSTVSRGTAEKIHVVMKSASNSRRNSSVSSVCSNRSARDDSKVDSPNLPLNPVDDHVSVQPHSSASSVSTALSEVDDATGERTTKRVRRKRTPSERTRSSRRIKAKSQPTTDDDDNDHVELGFGPYNRPIQQARTKRPGEKKKEVKALKRCQMNTHSSWKFTVTQRLRNTLAAEPYKTRMGKCYNLRRPPKRWCVSDGEFTIVPKDHVGNVQSDSELQNEHFRAIPWLERFVFNIPNAIGEFVRQFDPTFVNL